MLSCSISQLLMLDLVAMKCYTQDQFVFGDVNAYRCQAPRGRDDPVSISVLSDGVS
jgi:hypothetical protein